MTRARSAAFLVALLAGFLPAHAERADRTKKIIVEADHVLLDEKNLGRTLEGNVVITQGTMKIHASKVTVQEKDKFNYYVAWGSPVTYREKREKSDEWIEGVAERAEFDDRNEVLKLFNRAKVKSGQNETTGELITYNMRTEVAEVTGGPPAKQGSGEKPRVKVIIVPPKKDEKANDGATLKMDKETK